MINLILKHLFRHLYFLILFAFTSFNLFANELSQTIQKIENPFAGESHIYAQIYDELNLEYQNMARLEAERILSQRMTVTGGLNSIGLNFNRPFIDFGISLNRSLAPDLFDEKRWIVTDTFTISIDAHKVLNRLKSAGKLDITEKNLATFLGLVFMRKFTWIHFSDSYERGLMGDFHKLFFPFLGINSNNLEKMGLDEVILKEDFLSLSAGGLVSAPLYEGVNVLGGVIAKFQRISKVEVTKGNNDYLMPRLLISVEKAKTVSTGANLTIQANFLNILKMNLLSYDFIYSLDTSYKIYTEFTLDIVSESPNRDKVWNEIQSMIYGKIPSKEVISPYLISEEKKIAENLKHRYSFIFFGSSKSAKTQLIEFSLKNETKTFFRHYYEKIKYTEDLLSKLFSSLIFALTNTDVKALNVASETRKVVIEYDDHQNLIDSNQDLILSDSISEQKLSLTFSNDFFTKKVRGFAGKKFKEKTLFLLSHYSGVDPLVLKYVAEDQLLPPYNISGSFNISTDGIRYFHRQNTSTVFDQFESMCDDKPKNVFSKFLSLFDHCRRSLQNDYLDYLKDISHNTISSESISLCEKKSLKYIFRPSKKRAFIKTCLEQISYKSESEWLKIPLLKLKNLSQKISNSSHSKIYYYNLFGLENVFFHGSFEANNPNGTSFVSYFHEGVFKGMGVVDHFMRKNSLRTPASIVIDQ